MIKKIKYRKDGSIKKIEFYGGICDDEGDDDSGGEITIETPQESPQVNGASNEVMAKFSDREREILGRLGDANKVIARELGIAEATVKVHVKAVLRKLRMRNRTQAATWYQKST